VIARLTALVVLLIGGLAHADAAKTAGRPAAPASEAADPAVEEASEANLESTAERRGLTFSVSVGGGLMIGFGIAGSVGRGGALSLRLGHVATPHTVITFEITTSVALHQPHVANPPVKTNTDTNLLAGAQYYVNRTLWLRAAGGIGVYKGEDVELSTGGTGELQVVAPAVLGGIGIDVLRFKWAMLGLETGTSAMVTRSGVLVASSLSLGLSFQ